MEHQEMLNHCKAHLNRYVLVRTVDGMEFDGIVENVDDVNLYLAMPVGEVEPESRAFIPGAGYGFPGYGPGFYPGYFGPRRRFRRGIFPLAALLGLSLLPFY